MDIKPEIISQPLLTEEGLINPACLNELSATLASMPKTHARLSSDPEWNTPRVTMRKDITGALAKWACRQSPYGVPDGLETVCKYLHASLKSCAPWDSYDMAYLSLCDINRHLYDILYEQGIEAFDAWNRCKVGDTPDLSFASRFDGPGDPDRDFIDLDALLHNVCIDIRDERRKNDAFNAEFNRLHPEHPLQT